MTWQGSGLGKETTQPCDDPIVVVWTFPSFCFIIFCRDDGALALDGAGGTHSVRPATLAVKSEEQPDEMFSDPSKSVFDLDPLSGNTEENLDLMLDFFSGG